MFVLVWQTGFVSAKLRLDKFDSGQARMTYIE